MTDAQAKAAEVHEATEGPSDSKTVDDLEASETPESILLSTVSGEQSRDRTDRAIVTPWLKFLWETYRTVLDIFKNNARLEIMYQSTAHQAFQFCSKYARKTEFRRLCELLRNHLQNAAKFSSQMHAINLSDPDTLQRHLDTRFQQLNVAVELELWQEAFRSVEDIHTLLSLSKRPAKNNMMADYFKNLTRIFLVSENYLFHAAAWSRYYNLLRQSAAAVAAGQSKRDNPPVTEADMVNTASFVLLSALSIPVISTSRSRGALVDVDEARKNKNSRLTNLLGMSQAPTRAILFKDALSKGLLKRARPEIRDLYNILEVDFHPLSICQKISPILEKIGADEDMQKYIGPLQQVILTRLFQQLSQVYDSVEISFVLNLAQFPESFKVTSGTIEKFIMNGCKKGDLAIRIDHAAGVLTFDSDVFSSAKAMHPGSGAGSAEGEARSVQRLQSTPAEIVRSQLTRLAKSLYVTCQYVDPSFNAARLRAKEDALARTKQGAEEEHRQTIARRDIISRTKEAALKAQQMKENEEQTKRLQRIQQAKEEESRRLAEEQRQRAAQRIKAEQERVQREELEKQIKELKETVQVSIDIPEDITELDSTRIRAMKLAALEKEKSQLGEQLRIAGKRIDHLERAYRKEEIKHLKEDYERQMKEDEEAYERAKQEKLKEAEQKHKEDVALKHRLSRLVPSYSKFVTDVKQARKAEFEKRSKAAQKELEQKKAKRVQEIKERIAKEKREREEAERQERERQEREEAERAAKEKADEERRQKMLEEKARRDAERAYVFWLPRLTQLTNLIAVNWTRKPVSSDSEKKRPRPSVLQRSLGQHLHSLAMCPNLPVVPSSHFLAASHRGANVKLQRLLVKLLPLPLLLPLPHPRHLRQSRPRGLVMFHQPFVVPVLQAALLVDGVNVKLVDARHRIVGSPLPMLLLVVTSLLTAAAFLKGGPDLLPPVVVMSLLALVETSKTVTGNGSLRRTPALRRRKVPVMASTGLVPSAPDEASKAAMTDCMSEYVAKHAGLVLVRSLHDRDLSFCGICAPRYFLLRKAWV